MKYVYICVFIIFLNGCGDYKDPIVEQSTVTQEEAVAEKTKPDEGVVTEKRKPDTEELNTTKTHIRVLAEDPSSKIPEYLVKLPIQTN